MFLDWINVFGSCNNMIECGYLFLFIGCILCERVEFKFFVGVCVFEFDLDIDIFDEWEEFLV